MRPVIQPMREIARYLLIGPCLGACVGLVQTAVAACVWVRHGQPDFYFRGWGGVELGLAVGGIAGAVAGMGFAAAVAAGERILGRQVWVTPAAASAAVAVAFATWAVVEWEFARHELLPAFALEGAAVTIAGLMVLLWSRPTTPRSMVTGRGGGKGDSVLFLSARPWP